MTTNTNTIFQDARQAIAFAYLLEGLPARQDSPLGQAMKKALEEAGLLERPEHSSINLSGMTDLEVRGQCAMIRLAVEGNLPRPEAWAVKSRYGHTHVHTNPDKTREFFFSPGRLEAMRNLVSYILPMMPTIPERALMLLVARYCAECEQLRPSLRLIEKEGGSSKSALDRADKKMRQHVKTLIAQGVARLEPSFREYGVIPMAEPENRQAASSAC